MAGKGRPGREGPPDIHRRRLGAPAAAAGHLGALDVVAWPEGGVLRFRAMLPAGARSEGLAGRDGAAVEGLRAGEGGVLVAGRLPAGADALALDTPGGPLRLPLTPAEPGLLAGLDCGLALRLDEPAETVADWLAFHARTQGMDGAVIVNRDPEEPEAFAAALGEALAARDVRVRVVVFDCPVPLGRPGQPPAAHPVHAPDAPGKDRMDLPPPDAWRAPLGELLIHEVARWRFLAAAAAVANLDLSDLLVPPDPGAPSVFDRARAAAGGVVLLEGRLAYPWRLRPGRRPAHGDHICRPFDLAQSPARWALAPGRLDPAAVWLPVRVAQARPDPGQRWGFWRCMAIRHPGIPPSRLAPKTSLVEDPALVALATGPLGHRPVRPPRSAPAGAARPAPAGAARTVIVTTMKNEGPFLLEWIAYHRAIGVSGFLVYTNDCTDGTDAFHALLARKGIVEHRDNPYRSLGLPPQHAALQAAEDEPIVRGADWLICMDVDEYICVKLGDGRLSDLYAAAGEANMISLTWRLFGNAEIHAYEDRFVIEQFTRCAPELIRKPHHAWGFKTLFRNLSIYKKLGVHRPKGLKPDLWDRIRWLNGSGRPMPKGMLRNGWRSTVATYGYDWASLNHYAVRSAESFLVKRDRGRVNHVDRDQGLNYWFRMNHNAEEDHSILRMVPAARAEFARLTADPEIAAAHAAAVSAHRAKIAELRARPDQAAFYAELTSPRMERLCRLHKHFGSAVYAAGPQVIPDWVAFAEALPPDFFFTLRDPAGDAAEPARA